MSYKWEMNYQAEEVYEWYKREFPQQDYKSIAEMMAKAFITSVEIRNRQCDAYMDWHFCISYAYAVLDMEDEFFQYQKEQAEEDRYFESKDDEYDQSPIDDCFSVIGW